MYINIVKLYQKSKNKILNRFVNEKNSNSKITLVYLRAKFRKLHIILKLHFENSIIHDKLVRFRSTGFHLLSSRQDESLVIISCSYF